MEQNSDEDLRNAIDNSDAEQVSALLATNATSPFLVEGEESVILRAYGQIDLARSLAEHDRARRVLLMLLDALARERAQKTILEHLDLGLERIFTSAVFSDDLNLAKSVLKAGLDPNGRLYFDNRPWLSLAVKKRRSEIVRLLLSHGADPQELARENESVFQSLISIGQREIAWIILFHSLLGKAPEKLVCAFKIGAPDGKMEAAIKDLNLTETKALHLWAAMLENGCGRGAGAVVLGYCQSLGLTLESPDGAMVITLFLEHSVPDLSGAAITYLMDAGLQFPSLTDTDDDLAQILLCEIIEIGRDDALAALLDAGVTPGILTITPQNLSCKALDLVLQHRRLGMISTLVPALQDQGDLIIIALISLLQDDDPEMLDAFMACCSLDRAEKMRLLEIVVEEDNPTCLATLVSRNCHPSSDLGGEDINHETFGAFLLARALLTDEIVLPAPEERFDCARILLSDPNYDARDLDDLCQLIIVDRALVGDLAAVFFVCSYGFAPIGLLEYFQRIRIDDAIDDATKATVADSLCTALSGLIDFFDRTVLWDVKSLESNALNYILPRSTRLDQRTLIAHILGWSEDNPDGPDAPDLSLIELLCQIAEDEDNLAPDNLQQKIDEISNVLARSLQRHFSVPSLVELARETIAQTGDENSWYQLRTYLHHIYPTVIWDELEDRNDGYVTAIWSVIALLELHDIEHLAPLIFRAVDGDESDESSTDSFYYSESSDD